MVLRPVPLVAIVVWLVVTLCRPAAAAPAQDPTGAWPLSPEPEVVRGFDPPDQPWESGHRGVDLLGTPGQRVRSALPGVVTFAGSLAGRGVLVVSHGSTRTTYEPVTATVEVGTTVIAGERIGSLEVPHSHCFPQACLHWGWIEGETYLDPLRLVGAGPVRLLPLAGLPAPAWVPPATLIGEPAVTPAVPLLFARRPTDPDSGP